MLTHKPVLLHEVIQVLDPKPGEFFIDGTFGGGGHTAEISHHIKPNGKIVAVDVDGDVVKRATAEFKIHPPAGGLKFQIFHSSYTEIPEILKKEKLQKADMFLLDLGFSSFQIDDPERGFSFLHNAPLDMRYNRMSDVLSARDIVNTMSESELSDIFWKYGEERRSRVIAKRIVEERKKKKIYTTRELAEIVEKIIQRRKIHPATKIFQALRIYVNSEYKNVERVMTHITDVVRPGGRVAIISFHSSEDRIVKKGFRNLVDEGRARYINKKPIIPSRWEIKENPRSRSAKLRGIYII